MPTPGLGIYTCWSSLRIGGSDKVLSGDVSGGRSGGPVRTEIDQNAKLCETEPAPVPQIQFHKNAKLSKIRKQILRFSLRIKFRKPE